MNDCPSQEEISLNYFPVVSILLLRLVVFVAIRALLIWFFRLKKAFFHPILYVAVICVIYVLLPSLMETPHT
ncbi:hypothetical protein D2B06_22550 [Salmonella enterica]|uniref:DUF1656 domain-containing protein n=1 Tax=Salmonella enterica TaxID=28901 RepID=A0A7D8IXF3_SALER|nr:hypothetical protein [Salmonella enterica subsp. enterica]EAW1322337.1 hypothetical protein [Salmonella enterica subsp. diarizonae]EBI7046802.1 hypothetical protein [Salmonella enterica]EBK5908245.1 hypothetical protein [Salmonella enterica]MID23364.1 hypothetical protein [Salmonella enterica]